MLWGCGTCDMKSGVAVQLRIAATVPEPNRDLTFVFYDNEEVAADLNGLGHVAEAHPDWLEGDFAVLLEPSDGQVEGGCQGTLRVLLPTDGRARPLRAQLDGLQRDPRGRPDPGPARRVRAAPAGDRRAGVPRGPQRRRHRGRRRRQRHPRRLHRDRQLPLRARPHARTRRSPTSARSSRTAGSTSSPSTTTPAAPCPASPTRPPRPSSRRSAARPQPKFGWTDVSRFSALGVPAVNYGPGDPHLAHKRDERVETAKILHCEERLRAWLTA